MTLLAHHVEPQHVPVLLGFFVLGCWLGWQSLGRWLGGSGARDSNAQG